MKVLWFTNTPCSASEVLGKSIFSGGWLSSLEKELWKVEDLSLSISFYHDTDIKPFKHGKTTYYPVYRKSTSTKFRRFYRRLNPSRNSDAREIKQLIKIIELVKPDIIHVHGTEENFGLVQEYTHIPVVISIQGLLNPIVENYFSGIPLSVVRRYEGCRVKLLKLSFEDFYKKMKVDALREQRILKNARYLIGRTEWDKRITRIMAPGSVYFKVNEILRDSFYCRKWEKKTFDEELKLITITNPNVFKGFETIVKTAKILQQQTKLRFKWTVVGINENSQVVRIVKKWLKADLSKLNIELAGTKKEDELADLLCRCDIYCQVSHIENSSNSLCEALLIGIPTIATNVGGTASFINDSVNGILVGSGKPEEITAKINMLRSDLNSALSLGMKSKPQSHIIHQKELILRDLLNAYKISSISQ